MTSSGDDRMVALTICRPRVHQALATKKVLTDVLDFRGNYSSMDDFVADSSNEDVASANVIIIDANKAGDLSREEEEQFEQDVARLAPWVCVIIIDEDPDGTQRRSNAITMYLSDATLDDDTAMPFFRFVPRRGGFGCILSALEEYRQQRHDFDTRMAQFATQDDDATPFEASDDAEKWLGKVVSFTSNKGGSGKSTLSIITSTYLAHTSMDNPLSIKGEVRPLKMIVLDFDIYDSQDAIIISRPDAKTIVDLYQESASGISDAAFEDCVVHSRPHHLDFLLGPKKASSAAIIPPSFYASLIEFLKQRYDFIIIDTSVDVSSPSAMLIPSIAYPSSDRIVMVSEVARQAYRSVPRWAKYVTDTPAVGGLGIPAERIGVCINMVMRDTPLNRDDILKYVRSPLSVVAMIPSAKHLIMDALNVGEFADLFDNDPMRIGLFQLATFVTKDLCDFTDSHITVRDRRLVVRHD